MALDYTAPQVSNSLPLWKTVNDVTDGIVAMEKNKKTYIHQESEETNESYESRFRKATWCDFFNTTIEGLSGLIFKNPIQYGEDIPSQLAPMIENADLQGNHLDILIEDLFNTALRKGISFFYVDMPKGTPRNKAEEIQMGIKPYVTIIQPENVTSWKTTIVNGQLILSQVKIREFIEVDKQDDEFETELEVRYRVLDIGRFRVYQEDGTIIDEGETGLKFIPFGALNLNSKGFFTAQPPLYNLAKLNIRHFQIFTDTGHSAHLASVPMLKFLGFDQDEVKKVAISANRAITSSNPDASVDYLDYKGDGVTVNMSLMDKLELKMAEMGLNFISETKTMTATESQIQISQKQSKMNGFVRALKDSVELMLQYAAKYYNIENGGTISIDSDILQTPLTAEEMARYSDMVAKGQLSIQTLWTILLADKKLPEDFDVDVEQERVQSEGLLQGVQQ